MSTANSDLVFRGGGRERPLTLRRHPRARGMKLGVDPRDGRVTLTLPPRASKRMAFAWAEEKRGWIEAALAKVPAPRAIVAGGSVPWRGDEIAIGWDPALPRAVRLDGGALRFGGPIESLSSRVLGWMKREALGVLDKETRETAAVADVAIGRVGVGDPRARWGSCSASGDIRYSWRLILAPPPVLGATVAHEVAHRVHMHHGPEFHALVKRLFGRDPAPERRWLRANGPALYSLGRDS